MKRIHVFLAVATMAVITTGMFSSCKKDGVYNPKKKISRVSAQYSGGDKNLASTDRKSVV